MAGTRWGRGGGDTSGTEVTEDIGGGMRQRGAESREDALDGDGERWVTEKGGAGGGKGP